MAEYRGAVIIEWPPPSRKGPYGCMAGWMMTVFDAVSGKQITTVSHADVVVHADASDLLTADLAMFTDEAGEPVYDGPPVMKDGEALTATFPFLVAEMRVRQA